MLVEMALDALDAHEQAEAERQEREAQEKAEKDRQERQVILARTVALIVQAFGIDPCQEEGFELVTDLEPCVLIGRLLFTSNPTLSLQGYYTNARGVTVANHTFWPEDPETVNLRYLGELCRNGSNREREYAAE
jgi:hypothetical protein